MLKTLLLYSKSKPILGLTLPNVSFSTSAVVSRKFEVWTALAKKAGFTPEEVLDASTLGAYVVVDPMNRTTLLALSPQAYQKLLGQVLSSEDSSLILLFSPLDESAPDKSKALGETQNSPTLSLYTTSESLDKAIKSKRISYGSTYWTRGFPFSGYLGIGCKYIDRWLSFKSTDVFSAMLQRWCTRLHFWAGMSRSRQFRKAVYVMLRHLVKIHKASGPYGLALYLKGSYLIVLHYLSGNKVKYSFDVTGVGIRLASGLPAFLPTEWRWAIRVKSHRVIRIVLSILYTYRSFYSEPEKVKVVDGQMQTPLVGIRQMPVSFESFTGDLSHFTWFVRRILEPRVAPFAQMKLKNILRVKSLPALYSAGPLGPVGVLAYGADAYAWMARTDQESFTHPISWLRFLGYNSKVEDIRTWADQFKRGIYDINYSVSLPPLSKSQKRVHNYLEALGTGNIKGLSFPRTQFNLAPMTSREAFQLEEEAIPIPVGRLHELSEPVGKKRVIAMVDGIRQWLLKPLHLSLFNLIDKWFGEMSGIKSQSESVRTFANEGYKDIFCYDLSAATDSIDRRLYKPMLDIIYGETFGDRWSSLLCGSPFRILGDGGKPFSRVKAIQNGFDVSYGRGQPMGGYSSFACLELFHHLVIQYAHYLAKAIPNIMVPFKSYRVLGDDVVLADKEVATAYRELMSKFGVPISLSKSLVSNNGFFQFVSEVFDNQIPLSPLSLKADYSHNTAESRIMFAVNAGVRGWFDVDKTSSLSFSILRLVCNKDQYRREVERIEKGATSALSHRVISALCIMFPQLQRWGIGNLLSSVMESNKPGALLRGLINPIKETEQNFTFVILRTMLFKEYSRIHSLVTTEMSAEARHIMSHHLMQRFESKLDNSVQNWLPTISHLANTLWDAVPTEDWFKEAFQLLRASYEIEPVITRVNDMARPLDYIIEKILAHNKFKRVERIDAKDISGISDIDFCHKFVIQTYELIKKDQYYLNVLSGLSSPYEPVLLVSEEERPSGCT